MFELIRKHVIVRASVDNKSVCIITDTKAEGDWNTVFIRPSEARVMAAALIECANVIDKGGSEV